MSPTLTDVPGVTAGHWTHPAGATGVTVVRTDAGAHGGHWVPGGATGSREWGVLAPDHLAGRVHAVCLAGGSAFGLAAADGVMGALADDGVGFDTGHGRVPIVPAAILFDLDAGPHRPDAAGGAAAARAAGPGPLAEGRVGAGAGARVGRGLGQPAPGGVGTSGRAVGRWTVGVVVAVNAFGAVVDPRDGRPLTHPVPATPAPPPGDWQGRHTTLAVVATDAPLSRPQCRLVAKMASAAFARCFRPAFTPFDGDVVFALSTAPEAPPVDAPALLLVGDAAAEALAEAIVRAVR